METGLVVVVTVMFVVSFKPTYKEWKRLDIIFEDDSRGWVLSLPTRNGNIETASRSPPGGRRFKPTYKEWKHLAPTCL